MMVFCSQAGEILKNNSRTLSGDPHYLTPIITRVVCRTSKYSSARGGKCR